MPFGKHSGCRVADVPSSYLAWALTNVSRLDWSLRQAIEAELARRHDAAAQPPPRPEATKGPQSLASWQPVVDRWYREMVMKFHPDRGGSNEAAQAINHANDQLRKMLAEATA
jgi:hypothetical protein